MAQDKAKEIAFFDGHAAADDYNVFTDASNALLIDSFVRLTGLPAGARVADLGCGSGLFTDLLRQRGYRAAGIDISPKLLEVGRRKYPGLELIEGDIDKRYDWSADLMNERWSPRRAKKRIRSNPDLMICDVLLDQSIFSGLGNIIKNEILYRTKIHPESNAGAIPEYKLRELVRTARDYSFEFYRLKKANKLKKSWQAHTKKKCQRCDLPMRKKYTGKLKRRSFFCDNCQKHYG